VSDAYDPADGLIYAASIGPGSPSIVIVKPPCDVVATILPKGAAYPDRVAYDPVTREVVVTDFIAGLGFVLQGTSLVKIVGLGGEYYHCPTGVSWDANLRVMLIADSCAKDYRGGIDELSLSVVAGVTKSTVVLSAFDVGNEPGAVFVADGYVFSVGYAVDVYNDRTLSFLGSYAVGGGVSSAFAWDPLNDTVVLGRPAQRSSDSVVFLDTNSIRSGTFVFYHWRTHGILSDGAGGVAYSPFTKDLYFTAFGGNDVWELGESGMTTHVFLTQNAEPEGLAYDPVNNDVYVCATTSGNLYVIR
jgi:DNA-binding beta-propeller fold protein YncE